MEKVSNVLAWLLPFGLLVLAIVAVPLHLLDEHGYPRYRVLTSELRQVDGENDRIRREVVDLSLQVEALRSDPNALEQIARDDLGICLLYTSDAADE